MITHLNPYIAGNPVGGEEAFIGRADVLRDALRVIKSPNENGIVLYGQRRIGKTSVLLELAANLPQQGNYAPVYFDLQDKAAWSLEKVLRHLAEEIVYKLGISKFGDRNDDFVAGFKKDFLPYVLSRLPEETALVLLLDEFDVLDTKGNQAGSAFFPYLRNLMLLETKWLKFIFVIGRRPEDLSSVYLSLFKGVNYRHVSLLSQKDTADLVRLSERNDSLNWPDEMVSQVYGLTGGHPFLTQQLCFVIWENIYDDEPEITPIVQTANIKQAVPETLKSSTNSLEWLWSGLGPAERVVASALAEAGPDLITQEEIETCLQESGVRTLIGELRDAPKVLEEWNLIRSEDEAYRISVEMLRLWIVEQKPLSRVQDEIDRALPAAEHLFQAAYGLYQAGELQEPMPLLQQAVRINPYHIKANKLLAEILLAQGNTNKAISLLETLYKSNPSVARPRLIQALFIQAKEKEQENERLALYETILGLKPEQRDRLEALSEYQMIWEKRGDLAFEANQLEDALEAYKKANSKGKIKSVNRKKQLESLSREIHDALEKGEKQRAQKLFGKMLSIKPSSQEFADYIYRSVTGENVVGVRVKLQTLETEKLELQRTVDSLKTQIDFYKRSKNPKDFKVSNKDYNSLHNKLKETLKKIQRIIVAQRIKIIGVIIGGIVLIVSTLTFWVTIPSNYEKLLSRYNEITLQPEVHPKDIANLFLETVIKQEQRIFARLSVMQTMPEITEGQVISIGNEYDRTSVGCIGEKIQILKEKIATIEQSIEEKENYLQKKFFGIPSIESIEKEIQSLKAESSALQAEFEEKRTKSENDLIKLSENRIVIDQKIYENQEAIKKYIDATDQVGKAIYENSITKQSDLNTKKQNIEADLEQKKMIQHGLETRYITDSSKLQQQLENREAFYDKIKELIDLQNTLEKQKILVDNAEMELLSVLVYFKRDHQRQLVEKDRNIARFNYVRKDVTALVKFKATPEQNISIIMKRYQATIGEKIIQGNWVIEKLAD